MEKNYNKESKKKPTIMSLHINFKSPILLFFDQKQDFWDTKIKFLTDKIKSTIFRQYIKLEEQRKIEDLEKYQDELYCTPTINYDSDFEVYANSSDSEIY